MKRIPCKDCLILPICRNKKVLKCQLLLDYLNQFTKYEHPVWGNTLSLMRKTLKGSWYSVGINSKVIKVKKNKPINKFI